MKPTLKFIGLFFAFAICSILPALVIPVSLKSAEQSKYNSIFLLLFLVTGFLFVLYLIRRLNLSGRKLFAAAVVVFWGLQTFMTQVETWYFREAMPTITNGELGNLFLRPLITVLLFVPLAMWTLGKWKSEPGNLETLQSTKLKWSGMLLLAAIYVVIYFVFGYYVAWQFESVRIFYSGTTEKLGFMEQMQGNLHDKSFIIPFQFLRGLLWIIVGLPVIMYLKGGKTEKILACIFLYAICAIQLTVDNPFMPQPVRIAHLWEMATSQSLFGLLIGLVATSKIFTNLGEQGSSGH